MRGEWAYYDSLLSAGECQAIIDGACRRRPELGTVGIDGNEVDKEMRHGEVIFLQRRDPEFHQVFQMLDYCVDEANDEWFGVSYNRHGARSLQFSIYRADAEGGGHYYNAHQDASLVSGDRPTQRKLSVMVQLSDPDDYDGGEFQMHHVAAHPPAEAVRRRGTVLIFPSLVMHGVSVVTRGTRYSLVGWYPGPRWR